MCSTLMYCMILLALPLVQCVWSLFVILTGGGSNGSALGPIPCGDVHLSTFLLLRLTIGWT